MPTHGIVKVINVLGYVKHSGIAVSIDAFLDAFLLQAAEEGLCDSIIPTVSSPTHTRLKMICLAEAPPRITAVLRALI